MNVHLEEENLRSGVMALVVALVEILHELMVHQAARRMEGGSLEVAHCERLGLALMEMERVIRTLKLEQGLEEAVNQLRDGLDGLVDNLVSVNGWNAGREEQNACAEACAERG